MSNLTATTPANSGGSDQPANLTRTLLTIFLSALIIRAAYSVCIYAYMGNAGILGVNSIDYVHRGRILATAFENGTLRGWDWLGPNPIMMPLYSWLLAVNVLIAGQFAPLLYVLMQAAIDSATCLLIYGMARTIDRRIAIPAAIAAIVNPTQIVIAGQVYPDTPFVFFIALLLFGALHWLRAPSWRAALMIAAGLALSSWFRILVTPYAFALAAFLLLIVVVTGRYRPVHFAQLAAVIGIFLLSLAPILLRNHAVYKSWALTPQIGMHLARWVVPLIWEANGKMRWKSGYQEMERRAAKLPHPSNETPFQQSNRYVAVSIEALRQLSVFELAKGWLYGTALNLGAPGVILSPPIMALPRTGFYATKGHSTLEKMDNFIFHSDNSRYAVALLLGVAGIILIRIVQLFGLINLLLWRHLAPTALLITWCLYILAVNGPVASPKYRLPIEPAFAVLTGAGWNLLRRRMSRAASED